MNIVPSSERDTLWRNKENADRERLTASLNDQLLHKSTDPASGAISVALDDVSNVLKNEILRDLPDAGYIVMRQVYSNERLIMQILPI